MKPSSFLSFHKVLVFLASLFILSQCETSIYKKNYLRETKKKQRIDSLLFTLSFGMDNQEYLDRCWKLNQQQLILPSSGSYGWVNFYLKEEPQSLSPADIEFRFIGGFDDSRNLNALNLKLAYRAWAPWNNMYQSHVLIEAIKDTIMERYGGNPFFRFDQMGDTLPTYFKIDANRQFKLYIQDDRFVAGQIKDLKPHY
ncbi:MAG: hypothetical protein OXC92_06290 [Flavobacteriaceae bacterium]|nr:hypothetical protein [Flavobacteriaceae bacterium]